MKVVKLHKELLALLEKKMVFGKSVYFVGKYFWYIV